MGPGRHHHPVLALLTGRITRRWWWGRQGRGVAGARVARLFCVITTFSTPLTGCAAASEGPAAPSPGATGSGELTAAFFTSEQAARGERVFTTVCAACHAQTEFSGPIFAITWMADAVGNLFEHISTTMPQNRPGSLSAEEYAAVVAHILRLNGRTAGDRELPADVELLGRMRW